MAARALREGRIAFLNKRLSIHRRDGTKEARELVDTEQLVRVLQNDFEIQLPEPERLVSVADDKLFGPPSEVRLPVRIDVGAFKVAIASTRCHSNALPNFTFAKGECRLPGD